MPSDPFPCVLLETVSIVFLFIFFMKGTDDDTNPIAGHGAAEAEWDLGSQCFSIPFATSSVMHQLSAPTSIHRRSPRTLDQKMVQGH